MRLFALILFGFILFPFSLFGKETQALSPEKPTYILVKKCAALSMARLNLDNTRITKSELVRLALTDYIDKS